MTTLPPEPPDQPQESETPDLAMLLDVLRRFLETAVLVGDDVDRARALLAAIDAHDRDA